MEGQKPFEIKKAPARVLFSLSIGRKPVRFIAENFKPVLVRVRKAVLAFYSCISGGFPLLEDIFEDIL